MKILAPSSLRTISFLGFGLLSSSVYADATASKASWVPYVGAGVGYSILDVSNNHYQEIGAAQAYGEYSGTGKGPVEYVFLGSQTNIQNMLLGGEVYGLLSQQRAITNIYNGNDKRHEVAQRTYGYGIKLKAGYFVIPNAAVYLHGGIENAHFEYKGTIDLVSGDQNFKREKSLLGIPFGAGFEIDLSTAWKTRLEHTYTKYRSWKTDNLLTQNKAISKLTPRQHTIVLGFSYKF